MNVARTFKCYILKSELALSEYNKIYLSAIAFIYSFYVTLNQTAQVFWGTPGICMTSFISAKTKNLGNSKWTSRDICKDLSNEV